MVQYVQEVKMLKIITNFLHIYSKYGIIYALKLID